MELMLSKWDGLCAMVIGPKPARPPPLPKRRANTQLNHARYSYMRSKSKPKLTVMKTSFGGHGNKTFHGKPMVNLSY